MIVFFSRTRRKCVSLALRRKVTKDNSTINACGTRHMNGIDGESNIYMDSLTQQHASSISENLQENSSQTIFINQQCKQTEAICYFPKRDASHFEL